MWPHSAGARPWASTLTGKDPRVMAWWCLDGLPSGLAEPWRELWRWRSRPLHCVPPFSPLARSSRDHRNLRRRGLFLWKVA
ncbi:CCHCR1 isoform 26 [Pongo abelii]|uniref:CCHCR1 isoform 26 n=1 Tax=Pongo abelii TaxID=9601 RepID=A0A2J8SJ79_PONAB|nr:CCHCR1 isoform 26 [Pongo abelii]